MITQPRLSGLRVLVVEDEPLIAMLIEDHLGELGCQVVGPASTVAGGRLLIDEAAIDVAVLDLNLGGGETSYDLATELTDRSIPFMFITGHVALSLIEAFKGSPTLQKPFRMEDFQRALIGLAASCDMV